MWEGTLSHGMNHAFIIDSNEYSRWFGELPDKNKRDMLKTWGKFKGTGIPGLSFGRVFVTIQPPRVKTFDPEDFHKLMHDPTWKC